jgi:hypothetical protein
MMISLELAQKLKAAGLKWEPKKHDFCGQKGFPCRIYSELSEIEIKFYMDEFYWLPSLSQLLAEIEARGYTEISLATINQCKKGWVFELLKQGLLPSKIIGSYYYPQFPTFKANTPEEAAGQALLWILEQEGKHD